MISIIAAVVVAVVVLAIIPISLCDFNLVFDFSVPATFGRDEAKEWNSNPSNSNDHNPFTQICNIFNSLQYLFR